MKTRIRPFFLSICFLILAAGAVKAETSATPAAASARRVVTVPTNPISISVNQGVAKSFNVITLTHATTNNGPMTVSVVAVPTKGLLVLNADGTGTYTPNAGEWGADSFTFNINDAGGVPVLVTANVTINRPPAFTSVFDPTAYTGVKYTYTAAATDPEGDAITYSATYLPTWLSFTANNRVLSGTPTLAQLGINYAVIRATDSKQAFTEQLVEFTVEFRNSDPVAKDDSVTINEDTPILIDVLANDTDAETDREDLEIKSVTVLPLHGNVTVRSDGKIVYAPAANYFGTDTFKYEIEDEDNGEDEATVKVKIQNVNDAPVFTSIPDTTSKEGEAYTYTATATDPDGNTTLTYSAPTMPSWLTFTPSTHQLKGTPGNTAAGTYKVILRASDGSLAGDQTFFIKVTGVNSAPIAVDDAETLNEDVVTTVEILDNDRDDDGDSLTVKITSQPGHGKVTVNPNKTVKYTPDAEWSGSDQFKYQITDGGGLKDDATVRLTVKAVNDAPTAVTILRPSDGFTLTISGDPQEVIAIDWQNAIDVENQDLEYTWQLAKNSTFTTRLAEEPVGEDLSIDVDYRMLADALDDARAKIGVPYTLYHRIVVSDGTNETFGPVSTLVLTRGALTGTQDEVLPEQFALHGNYPNPFNPSTLIRFDLPAASDVSVEVFDVVGRRVAVVAEQPIAAGFNRTVSIDGTTLVSGTYLYRVIARSATDTIVRSGSMVLVK